MSSVPFNAPAPGPIAPVPSTKRQYRVTLWQKIVASKILLLSILVHFFFGVGATLYVVQVLANKRKVTFQGGPPQVKPSTRALEHEVSMAKKKNMQSAPAQAKRITTAGLSKIALPEMPTMPNATDVQANKMAGLGGVGNGMGTGGGGGNGGGGGMFEFNLPPSMGDRCSGASRASAMANNGGSPKAEEAIIKGLHWLKDHQNADGSFGQEYQLSMTGLALLSFMGHCERPTSKEFGPCVRKAIDFIVGVGSSQGGKLSKAAGNPWVYEHGIATYALAEAFILTREAKVAEVLRKSVGLIVSGQGGDGGWVYNFSKSSAGDTSVTGWQVQALKAANLTNLNIEGSNEAMAKAMADILRVRGPKGGFGYTSPEDRWSLTGTGVLSLQVGRHERGKLVREALNFAVEDAGAPQISWDSPDANLYAWYYLTQACFQHGGSVWHKWNREFQPEVLGHQSPDGSWPETGSSARGGTIHWTGTGTTIDAQVYRTSMCILMLEVYYRYLATSRVAVL